MSWLDTAIGALVVVLMCGLFLLGFVKGMEAVSTDACYPMEGRVDRGRVECQAQDGTWEGLVY